MSLVGSLEDLGLVDIIQIVSLSRKSGVLMLRSDCGHGRIVLSEGLVQGASIKGGPETLRDLLTAAGTAAEAQIEGAEALARDESLAADEALLRVCEVDAEALENLKREQVERAVMLMFGWRNGEFSFEIRDEVAPEDLALLLTSGLNTQYLAMEATRLGDEGGAAQRAEEDLVFSEDWGEESGDESVSGFDSESESGAETDQKADSEAGFEARAEAETDEAEPKADADVERDADEVAAAATEALHVAARPPEHAESRTAPRPCEARHLIVVDPDLSGLEWFKASVEPMFRRVHIFQRCGSAIDRIRQYLVRGVAPIVVIAETCADSDRDALRIVPRLRTLSSSITVLSLRSDGAPGEPSSEVDGALVRPAAPTSDPDRWHLYESHAARLRSDLEPWLASGRSVEARRQARNALGRLKRVSERLRDPSSQGEVLTVVLEFASDHFSRVALFMLRDGAMEGIAQDGLAATGGPDDEAMRGIRVEPGELPELFASVLEARSAQRGNLAGPRDRELSERLGAGRPAEAYVAPIESSGDVVALFYGDNFPEDLPIRDTTAFEIVLYEAGLVLDRAVLERALAAQA